MWLKVDASNKVTFDLLKEKTKIRELPGRIWYNSILEGNVEVQL